VSPSLDTRKQDKKAMQGRSVGAVRRLHLSKEHGLLIGVYRSCLIVTRSSLL
jgi:hypothetical protein